MMKVSAKALMQVGIVLLFLAVVARFGGLSKADAIGDDLAIGASALLVLITGAYARFGR
jgi:hypothetical protein